MTTPFATIKKPTQASDVAHVGVVLPLTAKLQLHDEHHQRGKDTQRIPVELQREEKSASHWFLLPTPDVSASGVSCVKRNRARESRAALCFATNITLQEKASSFYMEAC
jgi:hypothetical protein